MRSDLNFDQFDQFLFYVKKRSSVMSWRHYHAIPWFLFSFFKSCQILAEFLDLWYFNSVKEIYQSKQYIYFFSQSKIFSQQQLSCKIQFETIRHFRRQIMYIILPLTVGGTSILPKVGLKWKIVLCYKHD